MATVLDVITNDVGTRLENKQKIKFCLNSRIFKLGKPTNPNKKQRNDSKTKLHKCTIEVQCCNEYIQKQQLAAV
jgi:hypothetical protein